MREGLTELVFILDKSGSMRGLEDETVNGFNQMLKKQKRICSDAIVTTVLFDDNVNIVHDRISIDEMRFMTKDDYCPDGCTALLDAVGKTIRGIRKIHKILPEDACPEKTLVVIMTDGLENSSHEYTYDKVKKMIEKRKNKHHWEFVFLGANMDTIKVAAQLGVDADRCVGYECSSEGLSDVYESISDIVSCSIKSKGYEALKKNLDMVNSKRTGE